MKNWTIFSLLFLLVLWDIGQAKGADVDIRTIEFDIYKTFDVINSRTGRKSRIRPSRNRKVKIVGKNKWAYEIKLTDANGNPEGATYLVAQKWARRALNIQAALHAARLKQVVDQSTQPPQADCKSCGIDEDSVPTPTSRDSVVTSEDLIEPDEKDVPVVTDNRNWKPGCEVLAKGNDLKSADSDQLFKCVRSIQKIHCRRSSQ